MEAVHLLRVDWMILAVFLVCAVYQGSQGFCRCVAPLIVTAVSLVTAFVLSRLMAPSLSDRAYPWACEQVLSRMDLKALHSEGLADIASQLGRLLPESVSTVLRIYKLELYPFVERARTDMPSAAAVYVAERAVRSMLRPLTLYAVRSLLFWGGFSVLKLVLSVFNRLLDTVIELTPLRVLDSLGGAVIGLLWCSVVLYLAGWVAGLLVPGIFQSLAEQSGIIQRVFGL